MFFRRLISALAIAGALFTGTAHAQSQSAPFVPDFAFGKTPGMIAVRGTQRWQAIPAGTPGQVLSSNGTTSVPGWITPSGTGNVQTDGNAVANQIPFFSNGTTLQYVSPGGAALDKVMGYSGASPAGFMRRTGANTYSVSALAAADMPAFTGDCTTSAGSVAVSCANLEAQNNTWGAANSGFQSFKSFLYFTSNGNSGANPSVSGAIGNGGGALGWNKTGGSGEVNFWNLFSSATVDFSFYHYLTSTTQTDLLDMGVTNGFQLHIPFKPDTAVGVAYGGTNCTVASGTCLDNISGFTGTGLPVRSGPGAYTFFSVTQLIDSLCGTPTQGQIIYRDASSWQCLAPGTSGQFLAANGAGVNPSWAAPSAPPAGNRVLINTITASGSATMTDTTSLTATYSEYEIDYENLVPASTGVTACKFQLQTGGSFAATGYDSRYFMVYNGGPTTNGSSTVYVNCSDNSSSMPNAQPTSGVSGKFFISAPSVSQVHPLKIDFTEQQSASTIAAGFGAAELLAAGTVTGFQFSFGSGNIATGKVKVYGWN